MVVVVVVVVVHDDVVVEAVVAAAASEAALPMVAMARIHYYYYYYDGYYYCVYHALFKGRCHRDVVQRAALAPTTSARARRCSSGSRPAPATRSVARVIADAHLSVDIVADFVTFVLFVFP